MKIEWKGGIGYGDFVTGLGYAHNCAVKYDTDIELVIHWPHEKNYYHHPLDPESQLDRCIYIYDLFLKKVKLRHIFNSTPWFRFLNNFHEFNPVHGMFDLSLTTKKENYVLVWDSQKNSSVVGRHKDPLNKKEWNLVKETIQDYNYDVVEVNYRMPIKEVISLMASCSGGIGYNGCIQQIFKLIHKPVITFSLRPAYNKLVLPWTTHYENVGEFILADNLFTESSKQLRKYQKIHNEFILDKQDYTKEKLYNIYC